MITDFHKSLIPKVLPPFLTGPALTSGWSVLEPAGIASVGHGGAAAYIILSQKVLLEPPLTKTWPCKPSIIMVRFYYHYSFLLLLFWIPLLLILQLLLVFFNLFDSILGV